MSILTVKPPKGASNGASNPVVWSYSRKIGTDNNKGLLEVSSETVHQALFSHSHIRAQELGYITWCTHSQCVPRVHLNNL